MHTTVESIPFFMAASLQGPSTHLQGAQPIVLLAWEHSGLLYRYNIKPSEEHLNEPIKTRRTQGGNYHVLRAHKELAIVLYTSTKDLFPTTMFLVRYYYVYLKADVETEAKREKTSAQGCSVSQWQCEQFKLQFSNLIHHFHVSTIFSSKACSWRVGLAFKMSGPHSPRKFSERKQMILYNRNSNS